MSIFSYHFSFLYFSTSALEKQEATPEEPYFWVWTTSKLLNQFCEAIEAKRSSIQSTMRAFQPNSTSAHAICELKELKHNTRSNSFSCRGQIKPTKGLRADQSERELGLAGITNRFKDMLPETFKYGNFCRITHKYGTPLLLICH